MRILIVDDDKLFAQQLESALLKMGFMVSIANTVDEGVCCLQEIDYQLILLDYQVGNDDGLNLLEHLQLLDRKPNVVLMTSFATKSVAIKALNLGVDHFFEKPFSFRSLLSYLDTIGGSQIEANCTFKFIPTKQVVIFEGKEISLTETEYTLMSLLFTKRNSLITKEEIHNHVYNNDIRSRNSLNTHLTNLKGKLPRVFADNLKSIRGKGYIYESEA